MLILPELSTPMKFKPPSTHKRLFLKLKIERKILFPAIKLWTGLTPMPPSKELPQPKQFKLIPKKEEKLLLIRELPLPRLKRPPLILKRRLQETGLMNLEKVKMLPTK